MTIEVRRDGVTIHVREAFVVVKWPSLRWGSRTFSKGSILQTYIGKVLNDKTRPLEFLLSSKKDAFSEHHYTYVNADDSWGEVSALEALAGAGDLIDVRGD